MKWVQKRAWYLQAPAGHLVSWASACTFLRWRHRDEEEVAAAPATNLQNRRVGFLSIHVTAGREAAAWRGQRLPAAPESSRREEKSPDDSLNKSHNLWFPAAAPTCGCRTTEILIVHIYSHCWKTKHQDNVWVQRQDYLNRNKKIKKKNILKTIDFFLYNVDIFFL